MNGEGQRLYWLEKGIGVGASICLAEAAGMCSGDQGGLSYPSTHSQHAQRSHARTQQKVSIRTDSNVTKA